MKLHEIDWMEGKQYKDKYGCIWKVENASLYHGINNIAKKYDLEYLLKLNFEPCIDWSKVAVDTKVLVSDDGENWHKRYFAKYENGKIYVFMNGATSWVGGMTQRWKYTKLVESEE